ncbi:MAG: stage II sporulation protein M [Methanophagales archaeon]|nr:stage II sporulation protein M [Methanophagales archaeon]
MRGEFTLREYLYSLRFYILFVSAFFVCSAIIGYLGFLNELFSAALEYIEQLSENVKDFSDSYPLWVLFLLFFFVIFLNNAFTCFIDILSGPLAGIVPLFSAFVNGGLVGWFVQQEGGIVLVAIIPHGIFEIPAFLISAAIGLRLGREVFRSRGERDLGGEMKMGLWVFLTLILPLLVIAAIIESALITLLPLVAK